MASSISVDSLEPPRGRVEAFMDLWDSRTHGTASSNWLHFKSQVAH